MNPTTGSQEGVGLYRAGGPLVIHQKVNSIVNSHNRPMPQKVIAYLTDGINNTAMEYVTYGTYDFGLGETVDLSFPSMFR